MRLAWNAVDDIGAVIDALLRNHDVGSAQARSEASRAEVLVNTKRWARSAREELVAGE